MIYLLHRHKYVRGGVATFAAHLAKGLRRLGEEVKIVKIGKASGRKYPYYAGEVYEIRKPEELKDGRVIVTCAGEEELEIEDELYSNGALVVMHDPTHMKGERGDWVGTLKDKSRIICIRDGNQKVFGGGKFIRHPYHRVCTWRKDLNNLYMACCRTRITKSKNVDQIIKANSVLEHPVHLHGNGDRMYMHYVLDKKYEGWRKYSMNDGKGFDVGDDTAVRLASMYAYDVDLTMYEGDVSGTQYTLLEAMDAGTVPILNSNWMKNGAGGLFLGVNYFAVADAKELFLLFNFYVKKFEYRIANNNYKFLKNHDAKLVAEEYMRCFT